MDKTEHMLTAWMNAKKAEQQATEWRRTTEDALIKTLGLDPQFEGTENYEIGGFRVKVIGRMSRKVDADRLQEIAAEHGLSQYLSELFRWKPEINMVAWKATDPIITTPLADAVTTTSGRPSFSITQE